MLLTATAVSTATDDKEEAMVRERGTVLTSGFGSLRRRTLVSTRGIC